MRRRGSNAAPVHVRIDDCVVQEFHRIFQPRNLLVRDLDRPFGGSRGKGARQRHALESVARPMVVRVQSRRLP